MKLKKQLLSQIQQIILEARSRAVRSVNHERVLMYWHIGKVIFEEEQGHIIKYFFQLKILINENFILLKLQKIIGQPDN